MSDSSKIPVTSKATDQTTLVDKQNSRPPEKSADTSDATESFVKPKTKKKSKAGRAIENLEQFINFAYTRKGQKVVLKPKVERLISQQPKLPADARERLLRRAHEDALLAVPRQLLLVARDVVGFATLKGEIREFVGEVLRRHPVFSSEELRATLSNLPDAPRVERALTIIAGLDFASMPVLSGPLPLKAADLLELRRNATYCLAVWCAETRGLASNEVNEILRSTLWEPEAERVKDDTTRLRLLTEISELAGVGLACAALKDEVEKQLRIAQDARRSESTALEKLGALEESVTALQQDVEGKDEKIARLMQQHQEQDISHQQGIAHVRDDYEQLRGRLLRRLKADVTLLEEGLHALRRDPPKLRVMDDHAERALEGLRAEIRQLEMGE